MAKIGLPKGSGKRLKVREKSVKSQGILKWILSGNPEKVILPRPGLTFVRPHWFKMFDTLMVFLKECFFR